MFLFSRWIKTIPLLFAKRRSRTKPASSNRRLAPRLSPLRGEFLEDRLVPQATSFSQEFVTQVYTDLLQRPVDPAGLAAWSGEMNAGASEYNMVMGLEGSPEYKDVLVENMYQDYLNRPADPAGLAAWVGALDSGESVEQVKAGILGSTEFFNDAGGTNQGFLALLYQDVLKRPIDPAGAAAFGAELNAGASRITVAEQILTSTEGREVQIETDYQDYLGRPADTAGLEAWLNELDSGGSDYGIVAGIISSPEFSSAPVAPIVTSPHSSITVSDSTYTIKGSAAAGSLVQVYSGGSLIASEQLQGDQSRFAISVPLTSNSDNSFEVSATDAFGKESAKVAVPTITQGSSSSGVTVTKPAEQMNHEGDTVSLTIAATDSNGKTLSYTAKGLPAGLTINSSTGAITGTISSSDAANSPYSVTVTATDTANASGSATFTWLVDSTTKPTVTAPANQSNVEGATVSNVKATATYASKNPLTFSATNLPSGLSIDPTTGAISGTIASGDSANSPYTVTVSVTDGLNTGSATFTWTVTSNVTVTAPANQTNVESDTVSNVAVTATDSKGGTLSYSASNLPSGLSINSSTGVISGTIATGDSSKSPYLVTVTASDGTYTGSAKFTWTVNSPVTATAPANQSGTEGDSITSGVTASATDSKGTVSYIATGLPAGLSIDSTTGAITGTIGNAAAAGSPYTVTITASDGTYSGNAKFTWTVKPAVTVTAPANQTNLEGATPSGVSVTATDSKSGTLNYTAAGLPAGLSIDPATGAISGTIGDNAATGSPYTVTVTASDGTYSKSATFTWTVTPVVSVTNPANRTSAAGDAVSGVTVTATDANKTALKYSATGLPAGLSINSSTGVISGTIGASDAAGSPYSVTVTASDGTFSGSANFSWTVTAAPAAPTVSSPAQPSSTNATTFAIKGTAPAGSLVQVFSNGSKVGSQQLAAAATAYNITAPLTSNAANKFTVSATNAAGTQSPVATVPVITQSSKVVTVITPNEQLNHEGDTVSLPISATDTSKGTLTYTATGLPAGMTINSSTGLISGTLTSGDASNSPYSVTVTAKDAANNSGTASFTWLVSNSTNPTVTSPGNQTSAEGGAVNLTITATEATKNPLTYSAVGLPAGLSIDPSSGAITGTVAAGAASSSPYSVTVTATEGLNSGSNTFSWTITPAITITSPGDQSAAEGDSVNVSVAATDSQAKPLTYIATGLPEGLSINAATGAITGTVAAGAATASPDTVDVTVSDGTYSSSTSFAWTVTPVVTVTSPGNETNAEGDLVNVSVAGNDSLGQSLTYVAVGLPSGLSIDSTTGAITGTVANGDSASSPYTVTITASDGTYTGSTSFTWTVNSAVTVTAPNNQISTEGDTPSLSISATDAASKTLTYQASGLPAGLSINTSTGAITGTINAGDVSSSPYTVTVTASDGTYTGAASFTWTVNPVVAVTAPASQVNSRGDIVAGITVTATDALNKTLTYSATGLPAGLSINSSTGVISGTIGASDSNTSPYNVTVTATDGTYSGSATFTWTVNPITVTAPSNQSTADGDTISGVSAKATDATGKTLTYSATGLPAGLSINSSTGAITGTVAAGDHTSSPYTVTVTASDGTNSNSATFTWTVAASNNPVVTAPATQQNTEGDTVGNLKVTASSPLGKTLTYSATNLPAGLTINSSTGVISGKLSTGDSADSPYNVTVKASDGTNSGTASFAWVVTTSSTSTLPFSLTDPNWQTLPSGVRIWDVTKGTGATVAVGNTITVNFTGYLTDGTQFQGGTGTNFTRQLNTSNLIAGWVDGIPGMQVGGERRLDIPSSLAYGSNPPSGIPNNAELIFDITLTGVTS
jgi:hypothetical protein